MATVFDNDLLAMGTKYLVRRKQLARMVNEPKETLIRLKDVMDRIGLDKPQMAPLLDLLEGPITLQWFYKHNCHPESTFAHKGWSMDDAVRHGAFNVVQWLRMKGYAWDELTCAEAAKGGHFDILMWMRSKGCPWDESTCAHAAWRGQFYMLRWARANGCPWNKWTCAFAAHSGHLQILKWARANGCPWDKNTCEYAAWGGRLEVLQWARAAPGGGCPWNSSTWWRAWYCIQNGDEILEWLRANGCPQHDE